LGGSVAADGIEQTHSLFGSDFAVFDHLQDMHP
jgi:hypothetical protein